MCIRIVIIVYMPMNKTILYNNQAYTYTSVTAPCMYIIYVSIVDEFMCQKLPRFPSVPM